MRPTVKLGEICEIERGGSPRPIQEFLTTDGNGINWIKIGDTKTQPKYIEFTQEKIKPEGVKRSRMVYSGDFILSNSMSFGRPYIMKTSGCIHDGRLVLRPDNRIDKEFLYYLLGSNFMYKKFENSASGTGVKNLNIDKVKVVQIPLPPLETQKAIVAKLDQIFAELDQTKSEIQKNLDNTDELWKSALNQAFQGDWEMKTLQNVCLQKITDGTHQTPTYCGEKEGIPFISSKDVTKEYIDREGGIKYIPQSLHEELYKRIAPQKDDVLLAKNGTTGVAAIVEDDRVFDIYVTLAVLRPNQKIITPRFLHRIVNSPICKRQFDKSLKGAGVPNLHLENIKTVTIPVPPLSEQEKIVEHLDQVSKEVKALKSQYQSQLDNLEELKKSVLDKAFRGEMGE